MRRKNTLVPRILCAVFTLCFAAAMAAPAAFALTPQEEQSLRTDLRSLNNPDGGFALPESEPGWHLFHPDTWNAGQLMLRHIAKRIFLGAGEAEEIARILAYAPIAREGDALPPVVDFDIAKVLANLLSGLNLYVVLQESEDPDAYRIIGICTDGGGEAYTLSTGMFYNPATGMIWDQDDVGIMMMGYDFDIRQEMLISTPESWLGGAGFNVFYDMLAPLIFEYFDTLRFPFEYEGMDWQVQFWKGYYILGNGAEIGIYNKEPGTPIFYQKSDAYLEMTMQLYQKDGLYFDYGPQRTWWTGGFSFARPFWRQTPPKQLRMTGTILFEDQGMLDAFLASFEENRPANMAGGAEGLLFSFDWTPSPGIFG